MSNIPAISSKYLQNVFTQDYTPAVKIEGVQIVPLKSMPADEGDFSEILRLDDRGHLELFPDFKLQQVNRTRLFPHSLKGWHMHLKQSEIWYISPFSHIVVGLWDLREGSPTEDVRMKVVLGAGQSKMLFIPNGVAHGSVNFSTQDVELFYFVNQKFNINDPDEKRLHWDVLGADFWSPERD